ncbi:MAG: hypothetical protein FJX67_03385 [Alphaproteobacteria bacterium]|nr:hypothetical protein [Alphaproteobacteria bacterium]
MTIVIAALGLVVAAGPAVADLAGRLGWPIACEAGLGPVAAIVATAVFMVGPPAVLYENWLFYTGPVAWLLILAAYAILRFAATERFGWGLAVFTLIVAVVLTRSAFHLAWMVAVVIGLLVARPVSWRTTALASVIPLLLVVGLYAKNAALFATFGSSSWMGLSLAKLAVGHVPDPIRADLVDRGVLSRLALLPEFARPDAYEAVLGTVASSGIAVLDQWRKFSGHINYNHAIYPAASRTLWQDSLAALRHFPKAMAWAWMKSSYYYTLAPADYAFLDANRDRIRAYETAYDLAVYGKLPRFVLEAIAGPVERDSALEQASRMSPTVILALALALAGGVCLFVAVARRGFRGRPEEIMLLFMWATLLYLSIVCVSIEVFENNRMRFEVEPFLYVGALAVLARMWRRHRPAAPGAASGATL